MIIGNALTLDKFNYLWRKRGRRGEKVAGGRGRGGKHNLEKY